MLSQLSKTSFYCFLLSISFSVFVIYIIGVSRYFNDNHEDFSCDMTYMYEYPQFVRIPIYPKSSDISEIEEFPRFRLYAYGEGFVTERLRKMHFTGIPVLFIPGNAGSHEQVRSIASVSLRKSLKSRTPFHFDYFTVSLGKDYSALYGGVLNEETKFVAKCVKRILTLYQNADKSIVLIGHSMGGIIAKGALLLENEVNAKVASILITLATSHNPGIYPDYTFVNYYLKLSESMKQLKINGTSVVSIGGGPKDTLIPSFQIIDNHADINALSTTIPRVWRGTDHQCIVWCKQLVLSLVRSLFDCVNTTKNPPDIYEDPKKRLEALKWHFVQQYSGEKVLPRRAYAEIVPFPEDTGDWVEEIRIRYTWNSRYYEDDGSRKVSWIYLMVRVGAGYDALTIQSTNLRSRDWVFACAAKVKNDGMRACKSGINFSNGTRTLPGTKGKTWMKTLNLDMIRIRSMPVSHVVIRVPATFLNKKRKPGDDDDNDDFDDDIIVSVDMHSRAARTKKVSNPVSWITEMDEIRYYVNLEGITDAVSVQLNKIECENNTFLRNPIVELYEPSLPKSSQPFVLPHSDVAQKIIKLQTYNTLNKKSKVQISKLRLSVEPFCSYKIEIKRADLMDRLDIMVRDKWTLIYPSAVGLILLLIAQRIDRNNESGKSVLTILISTGFLCLNLNTIVEVSVAFVILHMAFVGIILAVVFLGSFAQNVVVRMFSRFFSFSTSWIDWAIGVLINRLPVIVSITLLSVVPITCGALPMLILVFLQFLKLTSMYEDYLEELLFGVISYFNLWKRREKTSNQLTKDRILDQIIIFLFWCVAALPAIPTAMVWANNLRYNSRLPTEDPIYLYSWIVMIACGSSGIMKIPEVSSHTIKTKLLVNVIRVLGWISFSSSIASYGPQYLWWYPPLFSCVVVYISFYASLV